MGKKMSDEQESPSARKIMIVDDDDDFRWLTGNLLQDAGYSVLRAQDGEEALKLLKKDVPDLILLDYRLPGRNGLQVAEDLKKEIPVTPIIMVTAYAEIESAVTAMRMGVYDYVTKPVNEDNLLIRIKQVLEKQELEQQVKELRKSRDELQRFIITLSTRFINLASSEIDSGIGQALEVIGKLLNIDRSYVFVFSDNETKMSCLYEWRADGIAPRIQDMQEFPIDSMTWFMGFMRRHEAFHLLSPDDLPAKATAEKKRLREQGIQSILCVPMIFSGSLVGFVGFDSIRERKRWTEEMISLIKIAGEMFVSSLERKRSEEALRQSEEKYGTILESTEEGYYEVDIAGNFTFFNASLCKILGYPEDEMMGMNNRQYSDKENARKAYRTYNEVYATGRPAKGFDWVIIRKDGAERNIEASVSLTKDREGRPIGFRGIVRDITERIKAKEALQASEARLRQAQKMEALGTLSGGIAHDFNNILGVANIYAELGLLNVSEEAPLRKNLEHIVKAIRRARDLVKQILAFSRQKEQMRMEIDAVPLIKEGVKLLKSSLPSTIEIQESITTQSGLIDADPSQIHQVLMNLCTNAARAMEEGREREGGVLTISLDDAVVDENKEITTLGHNLSPGPYLKLTVSDTGVGMGPVVLDRIFDPYFTTERSGKGTGLGLSVVHGIVQNHGGLINVQSRPGKGSTFEVFFPKTTTQIQEGLPSELSSVTLESCPAGTERILFVDDEEELLLGTCETLSCLGYDVVPRTDSIEALDTFAARPEDFDLVITDQTMPNMSGARLAMEILGIRSDIPIILNTGYSKTITEAQARVIGIKAFIMKPVSIGNLAKTIRRVLGDKPGD